MKLYNYGLWNSKILIKVSERQKVILKIGMSLRQSRTLTPKSIYTDLDININVYERDSK